MNIHIVNPANGRKTDYSMTYLATEARRAVRAQYAKASPKAYWVEVIEGRGVRLCVEYLTPEGSPQSLTVAL